MTKNIWALLDDRAGNNNQTLGLAEELAHKLKIEPEIKRIKYNSLICLPNFILRSSDLAVNKIRSHNIYGNYPDLVIAAGRRLAPLLLNIKKNSPTTKIVQIMRPTYMEEDFDLIITPQHDQIQKNLSNIRRSLGALNKINQTMLGKAKKEFFAKYPQTNFNLIGVFIGGNTKEYIYTEKDAFKLMNLLEQLAENHAAKLAITFSRRTPDYFKNIIYNNFQDTHLIYDPAFGGYNPYYGIMAAANFLIVTGDSISMLSEAASSGKALYIYNANNFKSAKHLYFQQQLKDFEYAKQLDSSISQLKKFKYEALNETAKIADYIISKIL